MDIVPYSLVDTRALPETQIISVSTPNIINGIHIVVPVEARDMLIAKLSSWFAGREEISFVDAGVSDKLETGYIILEWLEQEIDQLFIAILRDEDMIVDYTTYIRRISN